MYSFLVRPRWLVGHFLAALAVGLFLAAGFWQLSRLSDRIARNDLIRSRAASEPVLLSAALATVTGDPSHELEYRTVTVTGTYDPERELLVRSRSLGGLPGFHVVTPLLVGDEAVLVNRGFVPQELDDPPIGPASPPAGTVTVQGRVRASTEAPAIGPKDPTEGLLELVFWLDVERISRQMPYRLAPVTLELISQKPGSTSELPVILPEPVLDDGPHRGYAIQWFSFALIGLVGYALLIRRTARRPAER